MYPPRLPQHFGRCQQPAALVPGLRGPEVFSEELVVPWPDTDATRILPCSGRLPCLVDHGLHEWSRGGAKDFADAVVVLGDRRASDARESVIVNL